MDKKPEMILFHGNQNCDVPTWLLTKPEQQLLEQRSGQLPLFPELERTWYDSRH